ncbi:MAG: glucose-1-phosphate adenylyltransferase subunit GlgD [Firmicutes bacterium]|nr:glucose-1-phosphate adenylyltransferase subunit GlgD [Bacillota bacterium]
MNMLGLIFADEHDADVSELTTKRTFAAIPFGARYRLIDFFISNMTNSGIRNIGVVATTKYESLMGHVRYGGEWDLNRRKTGLTVLPPFSFFNGQVRYENVLEALQANISYITDYKEPYVLFTCCNAIGNIDYAAMLEKHIESGARFTCLCTRNPLNKEPGVATTEYKVDEDGRITDILIHDDVTEGAYVATHTYIMGRDDLLEILEESIDLNKKSLRMDVLKPALKDSKIMAYETDEKLLFIDSVSSYLQSNLDLLDKDLRCELFKKELRPIITRAGNSSPAFYGDCSNATNSLIAAGSVIEGTVKNSVIFRNVHVKKGAVIENCVINQDCTIGEGAMLNYAVLDKGVHINDKRLLSGYITHPFFVKSKSVI